MKDLVVFVLMIILGLVCGFAATNLGAPDWGSFIAFLIGMSLILNLNK